MLVGVSVTDIGSQFSPLHTQFSKSVIFISFLLQIVAMKGVYSKQSKTIVIWKL